MRVTQVEGIRESADGLVSVLARRTPVSFFGEFAALRLGTSLRSASVRCTEQSVLWRVTAADLNAVLGAFPSIASTLEGVARARMSQHQSLSPNPELRRASPPSPRIVAVSTPPSPPLRPTQGAYGADAGERRPGLTAIETDAEQHALASTRDHYTCSGAAARAIADGAAQESRDPPTARDGSGGRGGGGAAAGAGGGHGSDDSRGVHFLTQKPPLRRARSSGTVIDPPTEHVTDLGGLLASSRPHDAHYDEHMALDTLQQVVHARMLTEQTIGALERQLKAEHIKLRMLDNVECSLKHGRRQIDASMHGEGPAHGAADAVGGHKPRVSKSLSMLPRIIQDRESL